MQLPESLEVLRATSQFECHRKQFQRDIIVGIHSSSKYTSCSCNIPLRVGYRIHGTVIDYGQLGGRQSDPCSLRYSS